MTVSNPALVASISPNRYRGFDGGPREGWNVSVNGLGGMVLFGLPFTWAQRAVSLLNACTDHDAQRAELARIRAAIA